MLGGFVRDELHTSRLRRKATKAILFALSTFLFALGIAALIARDGDKNELLWKASKTSTGQAAAIRGSIPTSYEEANGIMNFDGPHFDEKMGSPYTDGLEIGGGNYDQAPVLKICSKISFPLGTKLYILF